MPDVVVTMSAKDAGLWAKFQETRAMATALGVELDIVAQKSGRASREQSTLAGQLNQNIKQATGGFLGLGAALGGIYSVSRLIMAEYERFRETRVGAVEPYRNILQAQERTRQLLSQESPEVQEQIKRRIEASAGRYLRRPEPAYEVFAAVHGASGDPERSIAITEALLDVYGPRGQFDKEGMDQVGGAMSDYMKRTGRTARGAVGMALKAAPFTRSEGPHTLAPTLRGINALMDAGMGEEESWALAGQVGSIANDPMGRHTSTNMIRMVEQMNVLAAELVGKGLLTVQDMEKWKGLSLPDKIKFLEAGAGKNATYAQKVMLARVQGMEMAANSEIRNLAQSMGQSKFGIESEAMGRPAMERMFSFGTDKTREFWAQNARDAEKIRGGATAEQVVDKFIAETPPELRSINQGEGFLGREEGLNASNAAQGMAMKFREELDAIAGTGWLKSKFRSLRSGMKSWISNDTMTESVQREMQMAAQDMENEVFELPGGNLNVLNWIDRYLFDPLGMKGGGPFSMGSRALRRRLTSDASRQEFYASRMDEEDAARYRRLNEGERMLGQTVRLEVEDPAGRPMTRARGLSLREMILAGNPVLAPIVFGNAARRWATGG